MDPYVTPESRDLGSNAANYRRMNSQPTAFAWWLRGIAATAIIGFAIFAADRALPSIAATAIEAEQQAELYHGGW